MLKWADEAMRMGFLELTIVPEDKDLGGFKVRRVLPHAKRRMVGPFIFLDHFGPASFGPGEGIDVRPHPHIGLATVTYLFEGRVFHRDTLGSAQAITPGAVNWMTAGRGIAHSERTAEEDKNRSHRAHGLQSWIALPKEFEEAAPEFHHYPTGDLPEISTAGARIKVVAGSAFGQTSPVKVHSPLFFVEVRLSAGASLPLPADYKERALYLLSGDLRIGSTRVAERTLPVFGTDEAVTLEARSDCHLALLGGDPLPEERFIWWNFVSSSRDRIVQAKQDWLSGGFGKVPGDEIEFIPLPD